MSLLLIGGSSLLTGLGLTSSWLTGSKKTLGWWVFLATVPVSAVYDVLTGQYGFLVGTAFATVVAVRNILRWTQA